MTQDQHIEQYLSELRSHLRGLSPVHADEVVQEIRAHLRDAGEQTSLPSTVLLTRLGPAAELAAQYNEDALMQHANRSVSPITLLQATLRLATRGLFGVFMFLCAILGYALGAGLVLTAVCKVFLPTRVGVWVRHGNLEMAGVQLYIPQPPTHDVLGWWYVPCALVLGLMLVAVTTATIRVCLRLSRRWQVYLQPQNRFA